MPPSAHSDFSASSSARLIACPGSFALGIAASTGGRKSSVYSAEGTLAHSVAEAAIFSGADPASVKGKTYEADGFQFTPDDDFLDAVQVYIDQVTAYRALGYLVALEVQVDPSVHWTGLPDLGIDLFGTADCVAYHPETKHVAIVDLKFGRGVPVEVKGNTQLLYYAAGVCSERVLRTLARGTGRVVGKSWLPDRVTATIVQPRAFHPDGPVREQDYTGQEIVDWARDTLHWGVERAINDHGTTLKPGDHCRWCPAQPCQAQQDHSSKLSRDLFMAAPLDNEPGEGDDQGDPLSVQTQAADVPQGTQGPEIADDKLAELLDRIEVMKPMMRAVENLAHQRLKERSQSISGWKLVPKIARRKWNDDPDNIKAAANAAGIDPTKIIQENMRTPAQVERLVGKDNYRDHIEQFVTKESSGSNLAPDGDPRGRVQQGRSAQEAFGIAGEDTAK